MQRLVQIALVVCALIVGIVLIQSGGGDDSVATEETNVVAVESPAEVMLREIESQIANQEDVKDVRCWSSVNKIQTFLSGLPVELEANGQRVERYVQLIDDVWKEAVGADQGKEVDVKTLTEVLNSKFPNNVTVKEESVSFDFGGQFGSLKDLQDSMKDYTDTIESWRLLQSWSMRKLSQKSGRDAAFSSESLLRFRDFLVAFDLGLLKGCKTVAMERKLGSIDSETVDIAFDRMLAGETAKMMKDD